MRAATVPCTDCLELGLKSGARALQRRAPWLARGQGTRALSKPADSKKTAGKRGGKRTPAGGRPPLAPEDRASRRISVRLYGEDTALLEQLCRKLEASETEIVRLAIAQLAASEGLTRRA